MGAMGKVASVAEVEVTAASCKATEAYTQAMQFNNSRAGVFQRA